MWAFKALRFEKLEASSAIEPKPRSGHRVVCNDTFMYSFGGFNPTIPEDDQQMLNDDYWSRSKPLFKEIWRFNLNTREWQLLANQHKLPAELASVALILRGNLMLIHGGSGVPFGECNSNQTYVCNVLDESFTELQTQGDKPEPQYGQAVLSYDKYFYSIGGTNGYEYTCDIHRLDLTNNIWEAVYICSGKEPCEPSGRYRHEVAFDGRRIFVLGGGTAEDTFTLQQIPTYDVFSNRWSNSLTIGDVGDITSARRFPPPRRCHGIVQYTDETTQTINVVISGGYNGRRLLNDVWKLNLKTLQWTCLPHCLPRPVYFHSTTITPAGCMITFGGITKYHSPNEPERVERTNAVHSMWLIIPKLTEICWLALNHYHPKLQLLPNDILLKSGIPLKLINRLRGVIDPSYNHSVYKSNLATFMES